MNITVPIFDESGNETGSEQIEVTELGSVPVSMGYGDGTYRRVEQIEISEVKLAHMDDVIATLDNYYGYFKYEII